MACRESCVSAGVGVLAINTYDEFGIPASTNVGRFQFSRGSRPSGGRARPETQAWLPEAGLFYYKARMYSPTLGRFLQTDPIGYADGLNWYNYVGGDPINSVDPLGLQDDHRTGGDVPKPICPPGDTCGPDIVVNGSCRGKSCDGPVDAGPIGLVGFVGDGGRGGGGEGGGGSAGTPSECLPSKRDSALETGLDVLGLAGDALAVAGELTGNPVLLGVGEGLNVISTTGSVALHISQGDSVSVAIDLAGGAAGLVPGARLARRFGGAALDAGRHANGRFVRNWAGRQRAQDRIFRSAQSRATNSVASNIRCSPR